MLMSMIQEEREGKTCNRSERAKAPRSRAQLEHFLPVSGGNSVHTDGVSLPELFSP